METGLFYCGENNIWRDCAFWEDDFLFIRFYKYRILDEEIVKYIPNLHVFLWFWEKTQCYHFIYALESWKKYVWINLTLKVPITTAADILIYFFFNCSRQHFDFFFLRK